MRNAASMRSSSVFAELQACVPQNPGSERIWVIPCPYLQSPNSAIAAHFSATAVHSTVLAWRTGTVMRKNGRLRNVLLRKVMFCQSSQCGIRLSMFQQRRAAHPQPLSRQAHSVLPQPCSDIPNRKANNWAALRRSLAARPKHSAERKIEKHWRAVWS